MKNIKVKKEYAEELTWKGLDTSMDFNPEYLETQVAIVDPADPRELEHLAQVLIAQLKRETDNANRYFLEAQSYKAKLAQLAQLSAVD